MTEQYQRVQPTPFDAPEFTPADRPSVAETRPGWLLPAFGGLGVLAIVVVFVLPRWVDSQDASTEADSAAPATAGSTSQDAAQSTPAARTSPQETGSPASPFADARAAKARAEAQDLLAELLDVQENLTERGAEEWASEAMAGIATQALAGDELYRDREFDSAIEQYQQALTEALALEQSLPERFQEQVAAAENAIEALDPDTAAAALALAEKLEPGAPETASLAERLEVLPTVMESVAAALDSEAAGNLADAVTNIELAADADSEHQRVQGELQRLTVALTSQRFNSAMSEGYAALDTADFDTAQQRFERAASLNPGSSEASAALQELSAARTASTLQRLQNRGSTLLQEEDWAGAIKVFEEALAIDQSLRFAREGLAVAEPRGQIEKELTAIVKQPERLVDDAILREAQSSVTRAQSIGGLGPRLTTQLEAAQDVLSVASTPLPVSLSSDGLTEVTVYKVARLGLFDSEQLSLRPGQYTAVGSRRGYRDVRVVFTVSPGSSESVHIACTELI
ncbi:tetratricopeptide repeat protein [Congregibacter sp.]|uniref:tetratricopeptide repeat protein n=1 Tax=Congregibacter sp. TaxID=2744308 RepID=UPI003F6D371A